MCDFWVKLPEMPVDSSRCAPASASSLRLACCELPSVACGNGCGFPKISHVISLSTFQVLKYGRCNCNVCEASRKLTEGNYVRLLGEAPRGTCRKFVLCSGLGPGHLPPPPATCPRPPAPGPGRAPPGPGPCAEGESARAGPRRPVGCNQSTGTGVRRARRGSCP